MPAEITVRFWAGARRAAGHEFETIAVESNRERALHFGSRVQPHAHFRDDAERSPRPGEQPRQVEPGDVLHNAASPARDRAAARRELEAEDEIARCPVVRGEWTV